MRCRRLRLVQARIEHDRLLVQTARANRAKAEALAEHPMKPGPAEAAASGRIAYWQRYLERCAA